MLSKLVKRLTIGIPTLLGVSFILFYLMSILPGDPVAGLLPDDAPQEARDELRREMGLDRPILVRYASWLGDTLQGEMGYSRQRRRDVSELIGQAWKNTASLAVVTGVVGISTGILMGTVAAMNRGRWLDRVLSVTAIAGFSLPNFWLAIVLLIVFSANLQWLPSSGMHGPEGGLVDYVKHLIMPVVAGSVGIVAITARTARASIVETYSADFVDLLRAKGLSSLQILLHVSKNAVSPVLITSGVTIGNLLGGSVLIETIFSWPGLGQLTYIAISARDLLVVQAALLLIAVVFVMLNIIVDLLQAVFDPRQRRLA